MPGRISSVQRKHLRALTQKGEVTVSIPRADPDKDHHQIAVGDWVILGKEEEYHPYEIQEIIPRKNMLSRKAPGRNTGEQVIAANVDIVLIMTDLLQDFNIRRLERYLALVYGIGAEPVFILNKKDLCEYPDKLIEHAQNLGDNIRVIDISALNGDDVRKVSELLDKGTTAVLLGSSGVGKSTLINGLLGYCRQSVSDIRSSDGKGRHTTTSRELIHLPGKGMIIDNPGIREVQLWGAEEGVSAVFNDIEQLSMGCKFKDCDHGSEPGCAVKKAIKRGEISRDRFESYRKLQREIMHTERKRSTYEKRKFDRDRTKYYRKVANMHRAERKYQ